MKCGANVVDGKLPRISVCQCKPGFYRPKTKENDHNVNCEGNHIHAISLNLITIVHFDKMLHRGKTQES